MTLDEAIKHCEEVAEEAKMTPCIKGGLVEKCGQEHEQLAEWLKELKAYKEKPQGEWIFVSRNCWKCPYCQELTNEGKNFCPNCGAKMKGGAE